MDIVYTLTEGFQHIAINQMYFLSVIVRHTVQYRRLALDIFTEVDRMDNAGQYHLILFVYLLQDFHLSSVIT